MSRVRSRPKPDRRRALELLAASTDGCTEAILLAHDIKSDRGVDLASDYRGVPMGPCASILHQGPGQDQGPGQVVWIGLRATSVRYGHSRSAERPAITLAKRLH
jgi:hypothetical protein